MKMDSPAGITTYKATFLRRLIPLLLGICLLALAATGCASGNPPVSRTSSTSTSSAPGGTVRKTGHSRHPLALKAYRATTGEGSARVRIREIEYGLPPLPKRGAHHPEIRIDGSGVVDFTSDRARVRVSTPGAGHARLRQLGYTIYEKSSSHGPAGRSRWVRMNLLALAGGRGAYLAQLASGQLNDPVHQLDYLEGVVPDKTRKLGRQEVRGVPTTRYRMVVDLNEMIEKNPRARALYEELKQELGSSRLKVRVWLDSRDRVRRFESTVPIEIPRTKPGRSAGSERGRIRISSEYYDFRVPTRVKAPPARETTRVKVPSSR